MTRSPVGERSRAGRPALRCRRASLLTAGFATGGAAKKPSPVALDLDALRQPGSEARATSPSSIGGRHYLRERAAARAVALGDLLGVDADVRVFRAVKKVEGVRVGIGRGRDPDDRLRGRSCDRDRADARRCPRLPDRREPTWMSHEKVHSVLRDPISPASELRALAPGHVMEAARREDLNRGRLIVELRR